MKRQIIVQLELDLYHQDEDLTMGSSITPAIPKIYAKYVNDACQTKVDFSLMWIFLLNRDRIRNNLFDKEKN